MEFQSFEATLVAALFGLLLGLIVQRSKDVSETKELRGKIDDLEKETEIKEAEIAGDLYESLYELHDGLVKTVHSYDSALKTVLDKLPTPTERLKQLNQSAPRPVSLIEKAGTSESAGTAAPLSGKIDILEEESFSEKTSEFRSEQSSESSAS